MKTKINNRKDGHAVINAIGDNEAAIKRLQRATSRSRRSEGVEVGEA